MSKNKFKEGDRVTIPQKEENYPRLPGTIIFHAAGVYTISLDNGVMRNVAEDMLEYEQG
jgi:hypothetical protein